MKRIGKYVLIFVLMINIVACAEKAKDHATWVSVVKPPIQVVYVSRDKDIDPSLIHSLVTQVSRVPYKDYYFNENIGVSLTGNVNRSFTDTEVDSRSMSVMVD